MSESNDDKEDTPTKEPHDCYDKEKAIFKKTGIHIPPQDIHDIITIMCINLNFQSAEEMLDWINTSTKEAIEAEIERAKKSYQYGQRKDKKREMLVAYQ